MTVAMVKGAFVVRQLQDLRCVGSEHRVFLTRLNMQPWIIEELWRREEEEKQRREQEQRRQEIHIDAPDGPMPTEQPAREEDDEQKRGVLIIEL